MYKQNELYNILDQKMVKIGRFEVAVEQIEANNIIQPYSYVKIKHCVCILAFIHDKLLLINQYRHTVSSWLWEIPGGMIDEGETPEEAAKRELEEETGYFVESIESLGFYYPSPGSTTEIAYIFYASCSQKGKIELDPLEIIHNGIFSIEEFEQMIQENVFCHGMGLVAWSKYLILRGKSNVSEIIKT